MSNERHANPTTDRETESKPPVFSQKRGRLKLAIWANEASDGKCRHSVEITRTYKVDEGFRSTARLDSRDLLVAARLAVAADDWISEVESEQ